MGKLADSISIKGVNTCECLLTYGFLVVSKEQSSEFFPLEEVFSMVFGFGHCKHILMRVALISTTRVKLKFQSLLRCRDHCVQMLLHLLCTVPVFRAGLCGINRVACEWPTKVAHFLYCGIVIMPWSQSVVRCVLLHFRRSTFNGWYIDTEFFFGEVSRVVVLISIEISWGMHLLCHAVHVQSWIALTIF